eukprot:12001726-Karenia_brevis.AAC.1
MYVLDDSSRRSPTHGYHPAAKVHVPVAWQPNLAAVDLFVEGHIFVPYPRKQVHIEAALQIR